MSQSMDAAHARVLIVGAGGHGRSVAEALEALNGGVVTFPLT